MNAVDRVVVDELEGMRRALRILAQVPDIFDNVGPRTNERIYEKIRHVAIAALDGIYAKVDQDGNLTFERKRKVVD